MHFQSTILILLILNLPKDDSSHELSDKEGRHELRDEIAADTVLEGNKDIIAFKHYSFKQGELARSRTKSRTR